MNVVEFLMCDVEISHDVTQLIAPRGHRIHQLIAVRLSRQWIQPCYLCYGSFPMISGIIEFRFHWGQNAGGRSESLSAERAWCCLNPSVRFHCLAVWSSSLVLIEAWSTAFIRSRWPRACDEKTSSQSAFVWLWQWNKVEDGQFLNPPPKLPPRLRYADFRASQSDFGTGGWVKKMFPQLQEILNKVVLDVLT